MPLTKTGAKVKRAMVKQYGAKKGEEVFYATMNKYGKQWHKSPDSYEDAGGPGAPARNAYKGTPENVNTRESARKAGGSFAGVQQNGGAENRRADSRSKSATIPESGSGKSRIPGAVNSYDDTKDF